MEDLDPRSWDLGRRRTEGLEGGVDVRAISGGGTAQRVRRLRVFGGESSTIRVPYSDPWNVPGYF